MKQNITTKLSIGLMAAIITVGGLFAVVRVQANAAQAQVQKAQAEAAVADARIRHAEAAPGEKDGQKPE